jgi:hypothetical protein
VGEVLEAEPVAFQVGGEYAIDVAIRRRVSLRENAEIRFAWDGSGRPCYPAPKP